MNNYIFDLDGTLIDSSAEIIRCLKKAFEVANYFIDDNVFSSNIVGPPIRQIILNVASDLKDEKVINEIIKNYRHIYDYNAHNSTQLYAGIYDFLQQTKKNGKLLFIATNKPIIPTLRIVKKLDIYDKFNDIYCIGMSSICLNKTEMIKDIIGKYKLDREYTYMIGDCNSDIIAGQNAGVKTVGCLWGYEKKKSFIKENADFFISSIEELECVK
ncbi:MAG: HAD family hydrolase [Endomicrobium sp.]|jgi:phosphoglycolate phosphatase|nr:HAD family hydrolase [Endomicrobium sp.]